jgi:Peptidase inhibitor family I36
MRFTRRSAQAVVATTVFAAGLVGMSAAPANAATCLAGYTCAWKDANALGNMCRFAGDNNDWSLFTGSAGTTCNDMASSFLNNHATKHMRYFENTFMMLAHDCVLKGQYQPTISGAMNDRTSSNEYFSPPTPC